MMAPCVPSSPQVQLFRRRISLDVSVASHRAAPRKLVCMCKRWHLHDVVDSANGGVDAQIRLPADLREPQRRRCAARLAIDVRGGVLLEEHDKWP